MKLVRTTSVISLVWACRPNALFTEPTLHGYITYKHVLGSVNRFGNHTLEQGASVTVAVS